MTIRSTFSAHRRLVAGLSVLALATAGLTVVATNALFTDSSTVAAGAFGTGTVDLTAIPATTTLTFANMAPGDIAYGPITVTNAGTEDLRYAMTNVATGTLAPTLTLEIKTVAAAGNCNLAGWPAGVAVFAPVPFNTAVLFGSTVTGFQAGDRALTAGTNEVLCAKAMLPQASTIQTQTPANATFTFTAEQTINN
jgi:hypothetical protein